MTRNVFLHATVLVLVASGCTIDVPFGLPTDGGGFFEQLESAFQNLVEDPLDTKPYPVLIGGDSKHVYYATSLTDVRINFSGRINDLVIPGFFGPSNLYVYADKQRELMRPLVPTGAYAMMATDGDYLTYVQITNLEDTPTTTLVAEVLGWDTSEVIFDSDVADGELWPSVESLALANGRLAFVVTNTPTGSDELHVVDLTGSEEPRVIESDWIVSIALRSDWLAYAEMVGYTTRVMLRDLSTDETTVLASDSRNDWGTRVLLTDNAVVWSEWNQFDSVRIVIYDIPTATTRVWIDAVGGMLTGATDDYFITEESVYNENTGVERIIVRRYDSEGQERKLADFRADGLAGQSCIIGDNAAWVNPDREVLLAPLAGGSRTSFRPF